MTNAKYNDDYRKESYLQLLRTTLYYDNHSIDYSDLLKKIAESIFNEFRPSKEKIFAEAIVVSLKENEIKEESAIIGLQAFTSLLFTENITEKNGLQLFNMLIEGICKHLEQITDPISIYKYNVSQ